MVATHGKSRLVLPCAPRFDFPPTYTRNLRIVAHHTHYADTPCVN